VLVSPVFIAASIVGEALTTPAVKNSSTAPSCNTFTVNKPAPIPLTEIVLPLAVPSDLNPPLYPAPGYKLSTR